MTSIDYLPLEPKDYEVVRLFLSDPGWRERVRDPAKFKQMIDRADRTVVAWEESRVVGFARALCDDVSNGYISMLAVALSHRGQGIGREIVRRLTAGDTGVTWVLRAGRDSAAFWRQLGFTTSELAMEKRRSD